MRQRHSMSALHAIALLLLTSLACNLMGAVAPAPAPVIQGQPPAPAVTSSLPSAGGTPAVQPAVVPATLTHAVTPSTAVPSGTLVYDVVSQDTAPDRRAPYGDSYDRNLLERPFLQDMTYVPDLDVVTYAVSGDSDWWYVSVQLIGTDPNNQLGIDYGVELDKDHDGFGDFVIWAHPPYTTSWDTAPVQIFADNNHDTGGRSAEKSDAPITTDGYETLVFDGVAGGTDPDVAWVRMNAGPQAAVQFAFKKSWSGTVFMLGVLADAGLKDPKKLDYVDRFTSVDAGSPVRDNKNYPLKALFAVDNVCRSPFGFKPNGYEPQLCPTTAPPATKKPKPTSEPVLPPPPLPPPPAPPP